MILAIILCISTYAHSICPKDCRCQSKTLSCTICISSYYQVYNTNNHSCQCIQGFHKYDGENNYCCPQSCFKCYHRGCATCSKNANIVWNETLKYFDCVCEENYQRMGSLCICKSKLYPQIYHDDPIEGRCLKCPENCICDQTGCRWCEQSVNRTIKVFRQTIYTCPCKGQLVDLDGQCVCYHGCSCSQNHPSDCNLVLSNRYYSEMHHKFVCRQSFIAFKDKCVCQQNYIKQQLFQVCVCKSKRNYTLYYELEGQCYKCPQTCTCNQKGCVICANPLLTQINYHCSCVDSFSWVNGDCSCIQPFFLNKTTGQCKCMSSINPQQYVLMKITPYTQIISCLKCPQNCTCSQLGCISCGSKSLRIVGTTNSDNNSYSCPCIQSAIQENQRCICEPQYYYNQTLQQCVCLNIIDPYSLYVPRYYEFQICYFCPPSCLCNQKGCYFCQQNTLRQVYYRDEQDFYDCPCTSNLLELTPSECGCAYGAVYSLTENKCVCLQYFTEISSAYETFGYCECKSVLFPESYFQHQQYMLCQKCPIDCLCNSSGCYDCRMQAMRNPYHYLYDGMFYFDCPCLQNAIQIDGICTICDANQYFDGIRCKQCKQCKTCNSKGCTSCNDQQLLVNETACLCTNPQLQNVQGQCICPFGKYSLISPKLIDDQAPVQCFICPVYCETCYVLQEVVKCLTCNINGTNRLDLAHYDCPCAQNYTETHTLSAYCCPKQCDKCDQIHCISCQKYTFRNLVQGKCICEPPYHQEGNVVCGCPPGTYYFNQTCLICPPRCDGCYYREEDQQIICKSCYPDSNRDLDNQKCPCLLHFEEDAPEKFYCYDPDCVFYIQHCTQCNIGMELNQEGVCFCPVGKYKGMNQCLKCHINGCLNCKTKNTCQQCNQQQGFYLVQSTCISATTQDFIIAYATESMIFQVKTNLKVTLNKENVIPIVFSIRQPNSIQRIHPQFLQIFSLSESNYGQTKVLSTKLSRAKKHFDNFFVSLIMKSEYMTVNTPGVVNIKSTNLLSGSILDQVDTASNNTMIVIVLIFMVVSLISNMKGYKHNNIIFYLQTIAFLPYYLDGTSFKIIALLYNMKVSYFKFKSDALLNFIPTLYYQSSKGNFRYLTIDSNLFRLLDLTIVLFFLSTFLFLLSITLYPYLSKMLPLNTQFIKYKKLSYRFFQSFFKALMYPIVFFSFNSLINVDCKSYVDVSFKSYSLGMSIFFLLFYAIFVPLYCILMPISRLYKIQLMIELVVDYVSSMSLIISLYYNRTWLPIAVIIVVVKEISYYFIRRKLMRHKDWVVNFQLFGIPIGVIPFFIIYYDRFDWVVASVVIYLIFQSMIQFLIILNADKIARLDKLDVKIQEPQGSAGTILQ